MSGSDDDRRAQLDDMLVELLAVGTSYAEAGAMAGLSERTVRRRMSVPEFATRVSVRRGEYTGALAGQLVNLGAEAVQELRSLLGDASSQVRLRAAQTIVTLGAQLRVANELETRLAALETDVSASQHGGNGA
jgi:hypothetical protein